MQDTFSHDKNNEDLIQDVYKELVDLGWFNNLEKEEKYSSIRDIDFSELYPKEFIISINSTPKKSNWVLELARRKKLASRNKNE
jgi:hypothetical protein